MSRLSEVKLMQNEREKNAGKNTEEASMRDICNLLERLNGNLEDISTSMALLVDLQSKGK